VRWPWRRVPAHDPEAPKPRPAEAQRVLEVVRSETPYFIAFAAELRRMREANHFAETIARAIREGR
jgi:hypothetical protein